jgi:peptide/nickel transport system substrate-binding protein
MKRSVLAMLGATSILTLSGWSANSSTTISNATASAANGTVVVAEAPQSAPNWFFPVMGASSESNTNIQTQALMYLPLLHITNKDTVDYSQSLAKKITVNKAGDVYTIYLNPKYHWSNGTPVTAKDFVFTWDIFLATSKTSPTPPWSYAFTGIGGVPQDWKSAVATSKYVVKVTTTKPVNPTWFILNGLGQISPVPEAVWNKYPTNMHKELSFILSVANSPSAKVYQVVDGAFKFQSYIPNDQWVFVPNTHFDGHKATIKRLIFQYETSATSEFTGLEQGTITVGYLPDTFWDSRTRLTNDVLSTPYILGFDYLQPNLSPKAPGGIGTAFAQTYVRQALEMGVDQPAIIKDIYHGQGVIEDTALASKPSTQFWDPALNKQPFPYNPAAGKKLLEKHGWKEKHGVMTKGKVQLKFNMIYMSGDTTLTDVVQLIKADWAQEGIDVTLQAEPFANVIATASQSDPTKWAMAWWGGGWTYEPDFYPSGDGLFNTGAGANSGGYSSPTMNALIDATTNQVGTAAQTRAAMDAYLKYLAEQVPVIWLPWTASSYVGTGLPEHAKNIHGTVRTFNEVTDLYYPNLWTLSK